MSESDDGFTIECSNCKKPLCEVWKLNAKEGECSTKTVTIVVKCPWCEDKSWSKQTSGRFAFGDTDYTKISTVDAYIDEDGNEHLTLQTGKAKLNEIQ